MIRADDAEGKGHGVFLVDVDVMILAPAYEETSETAVSDRVRSISDWLFDDSCPLHTFTSDTLKVHGFFVVGNEEVAGERTVGESIRIRIGAHAM